MSGQFTNKSIEDLKVRSVEPITTFSLQCKTTKRKMYNGKVHFLCSGKIRLDQCYLNIANVEIRSMLMLALC